MTNFKKMISRRVLLKTMEILPFYSQYTFSLLLYVMDDKHLFTKTLAVHNDDTRSANDFHLPSTNSTKYQKGPHYARIKSFNRLSTYKKCVANEMQVFKTTLKSFLLSKSFYSVEEYFTYLLHRAESFLRS